MSEILYVSLIGLVTGIFGTTGGGLIVILIKKLNEKLLSFVLGFSAGIMTVVVFLDLIPEALAVGSIWTTLSGIILGSILIALLNLIFPHHQFSGQEEQIKYLKTGLLLAFGIAIHNIPEGLAIGAGYSAGSSLGLGLAIIMGVQNLPEGMAVGATLTLGKMDNIKIIIITALSGIPMGIGAFLGSYLGGISDIVLSLSLGFAAGAMLYITFDDLIPDAHEKTEGMTAITGILSGVVLGLLLTNYL